MRKIKVKHKKFKLLVLLIFVCFVVQINTSFAAKQVQDNQFFFLEKKLIKDGFDPFWINKLYKNPKVVFATKDVSLFFVHSESKVNYGQFGSKQAIKNAKKYMQSNLPVFKVVEDKYDVNKEVITAIILVETQLGTLLGRSSILNVLSTMSLLADKNIRENFWKKISKSTKLSKKEFKKIVKRRSKWAYKELKAFLVYTRRENINPVTIYGSYAGALGIAQFMPSSIMLYAKNGNFDNGIDLFTHEDAIASVANYLKHHGWEIDIDKKKAQEVIYKYNHSDYYVNTILSIEKKLKK